MNEKWFAMPIEEIEKKLKTNAATGLAPKAADSRRAPKERPFFSVRKKRWDKLLLDFFNDFFLVVLVLVAVFSLFFQGDLVIGSAMLILIALNLCLSFFTYYRDKRGTDSMCELFIPTARVVRGGKLYVADYRDVVVGDVILIERGDVLGCDARLINSDALTVRMRIDKTTETEIKKYAGGTVSENELHAENMANMIHAGSTVLEGSARAIVVATGEYTYLGSITGGMTYLPSNELPAGLASLKKSFSKIGMILLVLTLPFCIFSLIFGHFTGGTTVLSETLSVALAIGACAMLSRFSTLLVSFYSRFIRKAALAENPCIIRSVKALDDMSNADYLFMLDGSITTDGILHFDGMYTVDGVIDRLGRIGLSAAVLADMVALYSVARRGALNIAGAGNSGLIDVGVDEFMKRSGIDVTALKIRCTVNSFIPEVDRERGDLLTFTEGGERKELSITTSAAILDRCDSAIVAGVKRDISAEGLESIKGYYRSLIASGRTPIVFTLKQGAGYCFIGILVLREGVDGSVARSLSALRRSGVRIIAFSESKGRDHAPEIPEILRHGGRVNAWELEKKGLPVTHDFGAYDEYCGFGEEDILKLAKHVKEKNKILAVMGFSEYAAEAVSLADVFITCAPVKVRSSGRLGEEIVSLEIPGEQSSASCTQAVKAEADMLLMRPDGENGGLEPLAKVMEYCRLAYRNLKNYVVYLAVTGFLGVFTVALPMLLGNTVADARHLLFLGFVFDIFVMLALMSDTRRVRGDRRALRRALEICSLRELVMRELPFSVAVLTGSALTLLLPNIFGLFSFFGDYIYTAEFTFLALLFMRVVAVACVYAGDLRNTAAIKRMLILTPLQPYRDRACGTPFRK